MKKDQLDVRVYKDRDQMGRAAARDIAAAMRALLAEKEEINMIFAAAPSQLDMLHYLKAEPNIAWERVNAFHMDEYVGISHDAPQGFANFLKRHLFDEKSFKSVQLLDCEAADAEAECRRYASLLAAYPCDIVCMGIGENGHIAFNDPHVAKFDDPQAVKVVDLDEKCRMQQVNDGCFAALEEVPRYAMTVTIPALVRAPRLFCVVPCQSKAEAVYHTVCGEISERCPASILRTRRDAVLYCDEQSGAGLPEETVRIGLIGLGNIGTLHAGYLTAGEVAHAVLAAVSETDGAKLEQFKEQHPEAATFEDYRAMMDSGLVDAVIIAVPHYLHPRMAIDAFERGLHVIVEKPVGVYAKDVLPMNAAAEKSGCVFSSMFCVRTDPYFGKIRELLQSGALGAIKRVNWIATDWYRPQAYHDSSNWRSSWKGEGGGVLVNQSPHNLDMLRWLFGMPVRVTATAAFGKYYHIEVEDEVTAILHYDGFNCVYIASTGEASGTNRLEIACDMGRLLLEEHRMTFRKNVVSERAFNADNRASFAMPDYEEIEVAPLDGKMHHKCITQNFINAILYGEALIAPGVDGIHEVEISNAIHMAAWTGNTVALPVDPDAFYQALQAKINGEEEA